MDPDVRHAQSTAGVKAIGREAMRAAARSRAFAATSASRSGRRQCKRILLIISGGIAAYKALELIRLLRGRGHGVTCVLTSQRRRSSSPRCRCRR